MGEWLDEKHGAKTRRSPRKLHVSLKAGTGQVVAAALTAKGVDDGAEVGPLLDQVSSSVSSFTAGAYDQQGVAAAVAGRHPEAAIPAPPRCTVIPSELAATAPTQRNHHVQVIASHGRADWQKAPSHMKLFHFVAYSDQIRLACAKLLFEITR